MSDIDTSAAPTASTPAASASPAPSGTPAPVTPVAAPAQTPSATPTIVGQSPAATTPTGEPNAYEARFGSFSDAEGNFTDGTRDYLTGLGFDSGRVERMMRQGGVENVFKALDHAQSLVEKRDGVRDYIPDPANENEFNQWRDQKGIPRDPSDPQNGYNFKAGLPEGQEAIINSDVLKEVGTMLHAANMPKEQANALIERVNSALASDSAAKMDSFANETNTREQKSYDDFKAKHGFEFEAKERQLGQSAAAYEFDYDDPMDRSALTNPKVMAMMVDLAEMSRTTAPMLGDAVPNAGGSNMAPQQQVEQIMKDHPNGAWKRDSALRGRVDVLLKQAAAQKKR